MIRSLEGKLNFYFAWIALYLLLTAVGVALAIYEFKIRPELFNPYVAYGSIAMAAVGMVLMGFELWKFESWMESVYNELWLYYAAKLQKKEEQKDLRA